MAITSPKGPNSHFSVKYSEKRTTKTNNQTTTENYKRVNVKYVKTLKTKTKYKVNS